MSFRKIGKNERYFLTKSENIGHILKKGYYYIVSPSY